MQAHIRTDTGRIRTSINLTARVSRTSRRRGTRWQLSVDGSTVWQATEAGHRQGSCGTSRCRHHAPFADVRLKPVCFRRAAPVTGVEDECGSWTATGRDTGTDGERVEGLKAVILSLVAEGQLRTCDNKSSPFACCGIYAMSTTRTFIRATKHSRSGFFMLFV